LYRILLVIQFVSVIAMLLETSYISKNLQKPLHGSLFFIFSTMMECNAAYLALMLARTEREAFVAMQIGYLGRI